MSSTSVASAFFSFKASPLPGPLNQQFGWFESAAGIGPSGTPGSAEFDPQAQTVEMLAPGGHPRADRDGIQFVYRRVKGDFILQALVEMLDTTHRGHQAGLMIRKSLSGDSAYLSVCVHADGQVASRFRRQDGGTTEELPSRTRHASLLQLSRRDGQFRISLARGGDPFSEGDVRDLDLHGEVLVGLFVRGGAEGAVARARFWNTRVFAPAPEGFRPYHDYIGSLLEVLETATGRRRVLHWVPDSLQAPNWTPDGRHLVFNHNGRIGRYDLFAGESSWVDTGDVIENNNDHALSPDGRFLGLSSGQPSRIYVVPTAGGQPRLVTPEGPSYLHGWSPDGRKLAFTGARKGLFDLYTVPSEGGDEHRLTQGEGLNDGSEFTPDGRHILFNSNRKGTMQLWRIGPDGSKPTQLTDDVYQNWFPHPSPDGQQVVFLSYRPDVPPAEHPFYQHVYLRRQPLGGGSPAVLAAFYGGQGSINVNSWSPDSRYVAFVSNATLI